MEVFDFLVVSQQDYSEVGECLMPALKLSKLLGEVLVKELLVVELEVLHFDRELVSENVIGRVILK